MDDYISRFNRGEFYDPFQLSNLEHQEVADAVKNYGRFFEATRDVMKLLASFLDFYAQVNNFGMLSLLSIVRFHIVQSLLCIRQMLEAGTLAAYFSCHGKTEYEESNANFQRFVGGKVYSWINDQYPKFSRQILALKNIVNEKFSHAQFRHINEQNPILALSHIKYKFMDAGDGSENKFFLWVLGASGVMLISLMAIAIMRTNIIQLADGYQTFIKKVGDLDTEFAQMKLEFEKELAPYGDQWSVFGVEPPKS